MTITTLQMINPLTRLLSTFVHVVENQFPIPTQQLIIRNSHTSHPHNQLAIRLNSISVLSRTLFIPPPSTGFHPIPNQECTNQQHVSSYRCVYLAVHAAFFSLSSLVLMRIHAGREGYPWFFPSLLAGVRVLDYAFYMYPLFLSISLSRCYIPSRTGTITK